VIRLTADQQASTNEATAATLDQLALNRDQTTRRQADSINLAAQAVLAHDHQRLVTVAVQLYVSDPTLGSADTVAELQAQGIGQQLAQAAIGHIAAAVQADKIIAAAAQQKADQANAATTRAGLVLTDAKANAQRAAQAIGPDTTQVQRDTTRVSEATGALATASAAMNKAVAAIGGPAPDGSVTILGAPSLDARQLAAWFDSSGFVDVTSTPITELAGWYISEGAREGVRGDVAFAQSIVETGGFSSSDAITQNNYAGIGHCDSCGAGDPFGSARLGVRGQMQLLRTYATPGLTGARLADPPAIAAVTPQNDFRRGCCASWMALTGTWATSTTYGAAILNVYQQILEYTVSTNTP
jgi:hypothetical protein